MVLICVLSMIINHHMIYIAYIYQSFPLAALIPFIKTFSVLTNNFVNTTSFTEVHRVKA